MPWWVFTDETTLPLYRVSLCKAADWWSRMENMELRYLLFVYSFTEVILIKLWNTPFRIQLNSVLNIRGITNQIIVDLLQVQITSNGICTCPFIKWWENLLHPRNWSNGVCSFLKTNLSYRFLQFEVLLMMKIVFWAADLWNEIIIWKSKCF